MQPSQPPIYNYNQYNQPVQQPLAPAPQQPLPPNPEKGRSKLPFIISLGVLIIGLSIVLLTGQPKGLLSAIGIGHSKKASAIGTMPPLTDQQNTTMANEVKAIIAAHPELSIGMVVRDINSGKGYLYGESDPYIAASISKLLTATLFLHQVQGGSATLSQTINGFSADYELRQMVENSDNNAWQAFNSLLGHSQLEQYATSIGLSAYNPEDNTLTVSDISTLLDKLYKKQLLNSSNTKLLLSYMNKADETQYIAASIPAGVKVYHKAGWLVDRVHDAAIIDNGKRPYVLVIFTKANNGHYDTKVGQKVFAQLTAATTKPFLGQ